MNTPQSPENPDCAIAILCEIPGLQMDFIAGLSIGNLLRDPLHKVLIAEHLLPFAAPPEVKAIVGEQAVQVAQSLQLLQSDFDALIAHKATLRSMFDKYSDEVTRKRLEELLAQTEKAIADTAAAIARSEPFCAHFKHALSPSPVAMLAEGNKIYIGFKTSNAARALVAVKDELHRLGWLPFSEIVTPDLTIPGFRYFYPDGCTKNFERHSEWLIQRLGGGSRR